MDFGLQPGREGRAFAPRRTSAPNQFLADLQSLNNAAAKIGRTARSEERTQIAVSHP
jgi:hypothetical protein